MAIDIQKAATRIAELERVRTNMAAKGHPDDIHASRALALKYVSGVYLEAALANICDGLDDTIARAKAELREALK